MLVSLLCSLPAHMTVFDKSITQLHRGCLGCAPSVKLHLTVASAGRALIHNEQAAGICSQYIQTGIVPVKLVFRGEELQCQLRAVARFSLLIWRAACLVMYIYSIGSCKICATDAMGHHAPGKMQVDNA